MSVNLSERGVHSAALRILRCAMRRAFASRGVLQECTAAGAATLAVVPIGNAPRRAGV